MLFGDVRTKGKKRDTDAAYSNWFNAKDGATICHENFKSENRTRVLYPSHVICKVFEMVAEKEQTIPSELHLIVHHGVKNKRIRRSIWKAARSRRKGPVQKMEFPLHRKTSMLS